MSQSKYFDRSDLINAIAEKTGCDKATVEENIKAGIEILVQEIAKGRVHLKDLGDWEMRMIQARTYKGFGKEVTKGARIKLHFDPAPPLRLEIQKVQGFEAVK